MFENKWINIDGTGEIDAVFNRIARAFENHSK